MGRPLAPIENIDAFFETYDKHKTVRNAVSHISDDFYLLDDVGQPLNGIEQKLHENIGISSINTFVTVAVRR